MIEDGANPQNRDGIRHQWVAEDTAFANVS